MNKKNRDKTRRTVSSMVARKTSLGRDFSWALRDE
jgi:hypothetical protein